MKRPKIGEDGRRDGHGFFERLLHKSPKGAIKKSPYIKACYTGENYSEIHVPPNWIQRAVDRVTGMLAQW